MIKSSDEQNESKEFKDSVLQELEANNKVEIGKYASWSCSSSKPGSGIEKLRDNSIETYWQSDAQQPHFINIQFPKKYVMDNLLIYSDYKLDESYTPSKISVKAGTLIHDLQDIITTEFEEPQGWINIPLLVHNKPLRANFLQISVLANHQNGRDTHIRQIKVYGSKISIESFIQSPKYLESLSSSTEFSMYQTIR
ncbi:hypothetical protein CYY_010472 [Polysphondylium violaceum]|uniref:Anaphase-promoting complex subunit 10 n=1 Tax=Polysphondylium violaceum TaxID=133409 RepID=A0A8J4PJ55_9MYCE|nr:hypothetical protein CYY_010472 [Polysphondylium violaceum]